MALACLAVTQCAVSGQETTSQFHKFTKAVTDFHDAYGYYPEIFDESGIFRFKQDGGAEKFVEAMSGQTWAGKVVVRYGNKDSKRFYDFKASDFSKDIDRQIIDLFGNTDIVIVIDYDGDGDVDIPDKTIDAPIQGKAHSYSRFDDGVLCVSTWDGLSLPAAERFKTEASYERKITMIIFTIITIVMFSAWWYVRDKIMD